MKPKFLLFLDFDGVVKHPGTNRFEEEPVRLVRALAHRLDAGIVISASWRALDIVGRLNAVFDGRILGVTPTLDGPEAGQAAEPPLAGRAQDGWEPDARRGEEGDVVPRDASSTSWNNADGPIRLRPLGCRGTAPSAALVLLDDGQATSTASHRLAYGAVAQATRPTRGDRQPASDFARHKEVLQFLEERGWQDVPWLALDDDRLNYPKGAPVLYTDPEVLITREGVEATLQEASR